MNSDSTPLNGTLILPRLRVQNVNAMSGPFTWGFPSITAFTGFIVALERKLAHEFSVRLHGVGVICNGFEPQVTDSQYINSFRLTRNPADEHGSPSAIVEEGRVHLSITLVIDTAFDSAVQTAEWKKAFSERVQQVVSEMRIAGGSVLPGDSKPYVFLPSESFEKQENDFRRLMRRMLPGFALVSRHDVLLSRHRQLCELRSESTLLEAWLDLSRLNYRAVKVTEEEARWDLDDRPGWLVPMPVGFAAISDLHPAGSVASARDAETPFQFVECVYSMGQWISPHRLRNFEQLYWYAAPPDGKGLYLCTNGYKQSPLESN